MIKLIDILNESTRVKMDPDFKRVLNNVVDIIFKKRKTGFKKYTILSFVFNLPNADSNFSMFSFLLLIVFD